MTEQLINTLKSTADFLQGIYADPSVTLRVREQSRIKEIALRQAIVDFEGVTATAGPQPTKPTKKLKVTPLMEDNSRIIPMMTDDSRIIPMEDTSVDDFVDKEQE